MTRLTVGAGHEPGAWLHDARCLDRSCTGWRTIDVWNTWLRDHVGAPLGAAAAP